MTSSHADALTVGADPGRSIADAPQIFLKTGLTDHESTRTAQTEGFLFFAAMTLVFTNFLSPVTRALTLPVVHIRNSFFSHWR